MGILVGFDASIDSNPKNKEPKDEGKIVPAIVVFKRSTYIAWMWYLFAIVVFALETIGCLTGATRFFFIAEYQGLTFSYFGICNTNGNQCTPSLLKQSFEVAAQIKSAQNTAADVQRLQNDITFAPEGLAIFFTLIGMLWFQFYDDESGIQIYYNFWFTGWWMTAIAFAFNAAWAESFGAAALKHSEALSNTRVKYGIAYPIFAWLIFVAVLISGLIAISWASTYTDKRTTAARQLWKGQYLTSLEPKKEIQMKVITEAEKKKDDK